MVGAGRCESGTRLAIGAGFGSSSPDGLGFGLEGASALGAVLCDPCGFGWSHWAVTDGGVRLGAGVGTDAVLLLDLALVLGLCWVQLTETKTNASNSSGDWMTQVNRVVAHTSVALVGMSICPISF